MNAKVITEASTASRALVELIRTMADIAPSEAAFTDGIEEFLGGTCERTVLVGSRGQVPALNVKVGRRRVLLEMRPAGQGQRLHD